jgi:NAD(P)-dependent dehydrogenase (short-subunit alcohol dehydrogenase family)
MPGLMPRYDLNGKSALITGGARGIGLATAQALSARGARVALVDLDSEELNSAAARLGPQSLAIAADVTDTDAITAAVARAAGHFEGGIDVLIANAGIAPRPATTRRMDPAEFERVIEVNLLGVYRTVRAGLEHVIERRGQVVVVSSVYAFLNGMVLAPYAAAKAGVEQLGRALRIELASHGASATVAYFGFVDTRMVQRIMDDESAAERDELLPAFIRKRITPQAAAEAVAEAIERRRARVIAPRYWAALLALRGILNPPLDYLSAHDKRVIAMIQDTEAESPTPKSI